MDLFQIGGELRIAHGALSKAFELAEFSLVFCALHSAPCPRPAGTSIKFIDIIREFAINTENKEYQWGRLSAAII